MEEKVKWTRKEYERVAGAYTKVEGTICVYCDSPANSWDHFFPVSKAAFIIDLPEKYKVMYPCCLRCNLTAGNKVFATLEHKRRYIYQRFVETGQKLWKSDKRNGGAVLGKDARKNTASSEIGSSSAQQNAGQNTTLPSISEQDRLTLIEVELQNEKNPKQPLPATLLGQQVVKAWPLRKQLQWVAWVKEMNLAHQKLKKYLSNDLLRRLFWEVGVDEENKG